MKAKIILKPLPTNLEAYQKIRKPSIEKTQSVERPKIGRGSYRRSKEINEE